VFNYSLHILNISQFDIVTAALSLKCYGVSMSVKQQKHHNSCAFMGIKNRFLTQLFIIQMCAHIYHLKI